MGVYFVGMRCTFVAVLCQESALCGDMSDVPLNFLSINDY